MALVDVAMWVISGLWTRRLGRHAVDRTVWGMVGDAGGVVEAVGVSSRCRMAAAMLGASSPVDVAPRAAEPAGSTDASAKARAVGDPADSTCASSNGPLARAAATASTPAKATIGYLTFFEVMQGPFSVQPPSARSPIDAPHLLLEPKGLHPRPLACPARSRSPPSQRLFRSRARRDEATRRRSPDHRGGRLARCPARMGG